MTFWLCLYSPRYPATNAHASYWHLLPAWIYNIFPHYAINGTIFEKRVTERKMCFDYLYNIRMKHFLFWNELSEKRWKMYIGLYVKYPLLVSDFKEIWIFSTDLRKIKKISNFMKIRPVGAEMFHAVGQTDIHGDANNRFSQLCESA